MSEKVEKGDVAYFHPMKVLCIFYGTSQPIAGVSIIGKVNNAEKFADVRSGDLIKLNTEHKYPHRNI